MTEAERRAFELKPVRSRHDDPLIPDDVKANQLDRAARRELNTLSKDNADGVARHLIMAGRLIEEDPELAHQHALSASRRAGRVAVVRETVAITAYATGDFALALRELRTRRRISGSDDLLPLMVDSERGVGRPDRALELGRSVDRSTIPAAVRVSLAIAMSGARLDLGQPDAALGELEIPELDGDRAFEYSPALFDAYAEVLGELGRAEESTRWRRRAEVASEALGIDDDQDDELEVEDVMMDDAGNEDTPPDGAAQSAAGATSAATEGATSAATEDSTTAVMEGATGDEAAADNAGSTVDPLAEADVEVQSVDDVVASVEPVSDVLRAAASVEDIIRKAAPVDLVVRDAGSAESVAASLDDVAGDGEAGQDHDGHVDARNGDSADTGDSADDGTPGDARP